MPIVELNSDIVYLLISIVMRKYDIRIGVF